MMEEASAVASDSQWRGVILDRPVLLGVQAIDHESVTIRLLVRTAAGDHFRVERALRTGILERLRQERVAWATARGES
jgi:hypothetical protein